MAREPLIEQVASFVIFFIHLLVLKTYFIPLFIIPTGSMAETLRGAHADYTCENCGWHYAIGWPEERSLGPPEVQCPNCRWTQLAGDGTRFHGSAATSDSKVVRLRKKAGDRIVVHGWPYDIGGVFGPRRWDVVVFKVPRDGQTNYIKRLIGLPGETIEIIDGDIFVDGKIARKPRHAQSSLWFPFYDHDFPPERSSPAAGGYFPRWVARQAGGAWRDVNTRTPRFEGPGSGREEIEFVTRVDADAGPAYITDTYGYNAPPYQVHRELVTDTRIACDVTFESGDGFVELSTTKYTDAFSARLYADGRVVLDRVQGNAAAEGWLKAKTPRPIGAVRFSLAVVDYAVVVTVGDAVVFVSEPGELLIDPAEARERERRPIPPQIRIAAEQVRASLAHLRVERDVYYTSEFSQNGQRELIGTAGRPITLAGDQYFVLGDNSPNSVDSRAWTAAQVGPHLLPLLKRGEYQIGTVPADQMIGPAFLVYWPGFLPLTPDGYALRIGHLDLTNLLPDVGRIRWIH